jgi:RHS repeat-associated protein
LWFCLRHIATLENTYSIFLMNITTGDPGTYTYTQSGWSNPHAATIISGIPQYYDQNGNLASTTRTTLSWDYRNRLLSYGTGISTTTFGYDHGPDRVFKATGTATTTYVSKLYNTDNSHTKHIFTSQGDLIATIIGTTASTTATTTYAHTDHLGGTSATTNTDGDVTELSDFYPYGTPRVSLNYTGSPEQRKYAGTERDTETSLDYMQHRYYRADEGRFVTIDPVFYEVGITRDGKTVQMDPQLQNSYSYAANNPIIKKDPEGRLSVQTFKDFLIAISTGNDLLKLGMSYQDYGMSTQIGMSSNRAYTDAAFSFASLIAPPVISLPLLLGEVFVYTGELIGAYEPEVKERYDKMIRELGPPSSQFKNYQYQSPLPSNPTIYFGNTPWFTVPNISIGGTNTNTPRTTGLWPRSKDPVGKDPSGAPIYCWGHCGLPTVNPQTTNSPKK